MTGYDILHFGDFMIKILVVEDDASVSELVQTVLKGEGYSVITDRKSVV